MKKPVKVILIICGVLLLGGFLRLGIFLYNVNRDLDDLYMKVQQLNLQAKQLATIQSQMARGAESQYILQRQIAEYQRQIDAISGQVQSMNDQSQRAALDYQMQELRKSNSPFERR